MPHSGCGLGNVIARRWCVTRDVVQTFEIEREASMYLCIILYIYRAGIKSTLRARGMIIFCLRMAISILNFAQLHN